MKIHPNFF